MTTKHKYYDLIMALANGSDIEYFNEVGYAKPNLKLTYDSEMTELKAVELI